MHMWEWHAFVDQSDRNSKWMHKLVHVATQFFVKNLFKWGEIALWQSKDLKGHGRRLTYIILSRHLSKGDWQQIFKVDGGIPS